MRNLTIGLIVGIVVAVPVGAFAWSQKQIATPIVGADCRQEYNSDIKEKDPNMQSCSTTVYKFTDNSHICYLVKGTNAGGIYCVKLPND